MSRCSSPMKKPFEEFTVKELQDIVEGRDSGDVTGTAAPRVQLSDHLEGQDWMDQEALCLEDEDETKPQASGELLNLSWRSEPESFMNKRWVKVESVVDSGASAPVAPPQMMPSVKIEPSEGSRRGQRYSSASKHKLKNLGQQQIKACTEAGEETEVLFQIADVAKPLVSVSAICEKGNRVIFGRAGGVVQNLRSGALIPFQRRNGIYVLSLWLEEGDADFRRP